jgi:hypothetical protein
MKAPVTAVSGGSLAGVEDRIHALIRKRAVEGFVFRLQGSE